MKICIYGGGAIGGLIAGRLAHAGHDISVVARGANLAAPTLEAVHAVIARLAARKGLYSPS